MSRAAAFVNEIFDLARRQVSLLLTVAAGTLLTALAVGHDLMQTRHEVASQLAWRAENMAARFQRSLDRSMEVVDGLASLYAASIEVGREEFRRYVENPLQRHPEFVALLWLPWDAQTGWDTAGRSDPADGRSEDFPLAYAEPHAHRQITLGALARVLPRLGLERSRDQAEVEISQPFVLQRPGNPLRAVAIFRPVHRYAAPASSVEQRQATHLGFVVGILRVGSVLDAALMGSQPSGLDVLIVDRTDGGWQVLHAHPSRSHGRGAPPPTLQETLAGPHHSVSLSVPGRDWQMLSRPAPAFADELRNQRWAWILALGMLLTGVLAVDIHRRSRDNAVLSAMNEELNRANALLARQGERLSEAQELAGVGGWEFDLATRRFEWSSHLSDVLVCVPDDSETGLGRYLTVVHPDDRPSVAAAIQAAVEGGKAVDIVHRVITPDGRTRLLQLRAKSICDDSGRPLHLLGTLLDITDGVRRAERLRLTTRVFDYLREAVVITDRASRILEVNPAFSRITGYAAEEVIGRTPRLWRSGRHNAAFYARLWQELRTRGFWQGEIWNRRRNGELYPTWQTISAIQNDDGVVTHYVSVLTDVSELVQSRQQLEYLAQHDPLTDLPNRLLLEDRLQHAMERAMRDGAMLAVLFLDLDRFKHINDSLGHTTGDRLLKEVAVRLCAAVRREDTVARMGGDEFIVLMEGLRHEADAAHLAQKLQQALAPSFRIEDREFYISVSIGISLFPRDGSDGQTLVRNADAAMYRAKERGRNAYDFYTESLTEDARERLRLESALRQAVQRGELSVHYQPQVDLKSGRLVGAEALLRWQHPELGPVPPDRFIPIAEETGLIIDLGAWVLQEACRQARAWLAAGLCIETVAVNVAGAQIQRSDFVATVRQALAGSGLPARHLELEVTESFIMDRAETSIGVLQELSRLGVRLSIDDFGTGYSSLAYLKRLPIDRLKVDRSFVRDLPQDEEDAAIAAAVITLGHSLGLTVIAEGVETAAQRDFLLGLRCDQAQGWYYGRPVPPERFNLAPTTATA